MILAFLLLYFGSFASADSDQYGLCSVSQKRSDEEIRVFILTVSPGEKVWSSFGHSLIWISNGQKDIDESFNFGTFDPRQPNLLYKYLNGELVYWLEAQPFLPDLARYVKSEKRTVVAQRLRLPPQMIENLVARLSHLRKDENKRFVYHWAKESCGTKIRDLIDEITDGQFKKQHLQATEHTHRTESLRHLTDKFFIWLGWTYMANANVDRPLNEWELLYSPVRLRDALAQTEITWPDGISRPLHAYDCTWEAEGETSGNPWAPETPPDHFWQLFLSGIFLGVLFASAPLLGTTKRQYRHIIGGTVILFGIVLGSIGTFHAMLFWSTLDDLHPNANQLLISPFHLSWIFAGVSLIRSASRWSKYLIIMGVGLSFICLLFHLTSISMQDNSSLIAFFIPFYSGLAWSCWCIPSSYKPSLEAK